MKMDSQSPVFILSLIWIQMLIQSQQKRSEKTAKPVTGLKKHFYISLCLPHESPLSQFPLHSSMWLVRFILK